MEDAAPEKAGSRGNAAGVVVPARGSRGRRAAEAALNIHRREGRAAALMCRCGLWVQFPGGLSPRMHSPAQRTPGVLEQGIIPGGPRGGNQGAGVNGGKDGRREGGRGGGVEGWISRLMNL